MIEQQRNGVDCPFFIFPEEVWEMIFEQLEDPHDLMSVREVHTSFEEMVNSKRKIWFLENAVPCLVPYLSLTDILNCRLVCKRWNSAIFNFYETHYSLWPVTVSSTALNSSAYDLFDGIILTPDTINRFYDDIKMRNYYRNHPIISRHVTLQWIDEEEDGSSDEEFQLPVVPRPPRRDFKQFSKKSLKILDDLGVHIWFLNISMETDEMEAREISDSEFFVFLQRSLVRLPNLKSVFIEGNLALFTNLIELARVVKKYPLPSLPNLERFIMDIPDLSMEVEAAIYQKYSSQLKQICMADILLQREYSPKDIINFTKMQLHETRPISDIVFHVIWPRLNCPLLQKLTLHVRAMRMATIHVILDCCPALQVFEIDLASCCIPSCVIASEEEASRKPNRSLKVLTITDTFVWSYDFFGIIQSLEYLVLEERRTMETFASVVLQENLPGFVEPPAEALVYQANFWDILPSLKKLIYKETDPDDENSPHVVQVYTRVKREEFVNELVN